MADLDANDKKIESGKRTAFHVYLEKTTLESKSQTVSFGCTLKKLSIYLDGNCGWTTIATVSIDEKVIARVRGDTVKFEYCLEEPIYPNSLVKFEITGTIPADAQVNIYGVIECNGMNNQFATSTSMVAGGNAASYAASGESKTATVTNPFGPAYENMGQTGMPFQNSQSPPNNNSPFGVKVSIRNGKLIPR